MGVRMSDDTSRRLLRSLEAVRVLGTVVLETMHHAQIMHRVALPPCIAMARPPAVGFLPPQSRTQHWHRAPLGSPGPLATVRAASQLERGIAVRGSLSLTHSREALSLHQAHGPSCAAAMPCMRRRGGGSTQIPTLPTDVFQPLSAPSFAAKRRTGSPGRTRAHPHTYPQRVQ